MKIKVDEEGKQIIDTLIEVAITCGSFKSRQALRDVEASIEVIEKEHE